MQIEWSTVPPSAWAAVLWAGIVATAGAHSCIAWAISRCSAVLPSTYGTMQPVVTGVLAAVVLGQVSVCSLRQNARVRRRDRQANDMTARKRTSAVGEVSAAVTPAIAALLSMQRAKPQPAPVPFLQHSQTAMICLLSIAAHLV